MRWVVWLLVAFATAVGLALLMRFNQGNVVVLWPPYRIDLSVNLVLALLAGVFTLMHLLLVGTARALGLPQRVKEYRQRRQQEQAAASLRESVLAFFEGRLGRSERFARGALSTAATAGPAALVAARAAHRMQERDRRDQWFKEAAQDPGAAQAVLMSQAEVAVDDRRTSEALDLLDQISSRGARHMVSLRTALRAYEQAERWEDVLRTLRLVEKRDAMHPVATAQLRARALTALLSRSQGDPAAVRALWKGLRADERASSAVAVQFARAFADCGAQDEARRIVEQTLDAGMDDAMVALYGRLDGLAVRDRLDRLEGWRTRHGDGAGVLMALGEVCAAEKLWGKAEDYLQQALRREPSVRAHLALGELYERLGRSAEASTHFRDAARLAV